MATTSKLNSEFDSSVRKMATMEKKCDSFSENLLQSLRRLKLCGKFSDFVVKVGGEDIPVHRNVISAASPYFDAMLSNDTLERRKGWAEIFDLDLDAVKTCIDFIYSGKANLSLENPEHLIQASDLMQIQQLKEMYFKFLADNITIETCLFYAGLASKYNTDVIATRISAYMLNNADKIFSLEHISKKGEKELLETLNLLPKNLPNREIRRWSAIEGWVKADVENRSKTFSDLFKLLLLDEIPLEYLTKDILLSDFVRDSEECKTAIMTSLSAKKPRPLMQDILDLRPLTDPLPRYTKKPTHVVARNGDSKWLHIMDFSTYAWSRYVRIPFSLADDSMVSIRGVIYLRTLDGNLVRYSSGKWENLRSLEIQLRTCRWLAFDDCIWFIAANSVSKYNPFAHIWTTLPAKLDIGNIFDCAISKDCLMAIVRDSNNKCKMREFNFSSKEWDVLYADATGLSGVCFVKGMFIAYRGKELEVYNPNVDKWYVHSGYVLRNWDRQSLGKIHRVVASDQYFCIFGTGKGAVCSSDSFTITKRFDVPTYFCLLSHLR